MQDINYKSYVFIGFILPSSFIACFFLALSNLNRANSIGYEASNKKYK